MNDEFHAQGYLRAESSQRFILHLRALFCPSTNVKSVKLHNVLHKNSAHFFLLLALLMSLIGE